MSRWIRTRARSTPTSIDLICLAHAGGSASLFRHWSHPLPEHVQLAVVLSAACSRYLAPYLGAAGIRVNLVAAGPLRTMAAFGIGESRREGFTRQAQAWHEQSPLGWDPADFVPVAKSCVTLLPGWLPATTGEILHVDGGRPRRR
ncbi:SDR family oxidoreductase [Actinoplanes sp. TFC3]|uniref:SDR family oxidoreductase n=1 Tax=Actinoplanes sp. TFC3 TaxID=1710355 RepID=UPI00082C37D1|nr:SDR family oxidoreductase [Actinoplanes sp. TFC3]